MTTWAQVHTGDTVRGADQRAWMVIGRYRPRRWMARGIDEAWFSLRLGDREVRVARWLPDPVDLVERAETARAAEVLINAGITVQILEESVTQPDSFTPAATPTSEPKHDRFGRYLLPHPETGKEQAFMRVSTVARTLADEYNLNLWKQRMTAKGLAIRPDLIAGAAAADPSTDKDALNSIVEQAMSAAESKAGANFGTALHSFTQRLDRGEPVAGMRVPPPLDRDLAAYASLMKSAGLTIEAIERVVILPDLGVAGRFDRIARQPPGRTKASPRSILDLKSGKDLSYSWLEIAIQQALYAHAPLMWDPATQTYVAKPEVDLDRALILHLPVGKASAQLYGVNIIEGWRLAQIAMQVRAARRGSTRLAWLVEPDDPAAVALHNVSRADSREELAALWEQLNKRGLWSEEVNAAAMARHQALQQTVTV